MSGILALYAPNLDDSGRRTVTSDLTRTMRHRGPDHQSEWHDHNLHLSLGHRRLAIVDLTPDGRQPMLSATGCYVITFSGDIHNSWALREELESRGAVFRGRSDTEVILAAIETWGLNTTCQKISGMFAIILWDRERKQLHLIRDHMGAQPLYFGWAGREFICASELKPFLARPGFDRALCPDAIAHYLHLGYIPAPYCIFRHVRMLPPGNRMIITPERLAPGTDLISMMDPFWSPARVIEDALRTRKAQEQKTYAQRMQETEALITAHIRQRMVADVPIGAFLNGDTGSSLIAAIMQRQSARPVKTYEMTLADNASPTPSIAAKIADHIGSDHTACVFHPQDIIDAAGDLPVFCDEPIGDMAAIPSMLMARQVRPHITAAISGAGCEELFGGAPHVADINRILGLIHWVPLSIRRQIKSQLMQGKTGLFARLWPGGNAAALTQTNLPDIYELLAGGGEENDIGTHARPLFGYPFRASVSWPTGLSAPEWMMFADTIHRLPGRVMPLIDHAGMAAGLEVRMPFIDTRLFAHAWSLPIADKADGKTGGRMLRDILARHVSASLCVQTATPRQTQSMGAWLRGPLSSWGHDLLSADILTTRFDIDRGKIHALWDGFMDGADMRPATVWRLLVLSLWAQKWLRS